MKSERKPTQIQQIIHKFILDEFKTGKYFWPKESKISKKLIQKYSFEFLQWVPVPFGYKIQSLVYFLTDNGRNYLNGQYFEYLKLKIKEFPKPDIELDKSPIGDTIEIVKKPKNISEFLKI